MSTNVYRAPVTGLPLITTISSGCQTPLLEIKYCNLVKPFYYPNSPAIPRYSVTCVVDPEMHKDFLNGIQAIEKNEKVDSILKKDYVKEGRENITTGKVMVKFQTKDIIPVYIKSDDSQTEPQLILLEDELARGEKIVILYDILRYTKKGKLETEHGLSFKPSCIYYYPAQAVKYLEGK